MSSSNPLSISVAAHQEQVVHLDAGTELRCVAGLLNVRFGHAGVVHTLSTGQAVRLPETQWVAISASNASRVLVQAQPGQDGQAQKNRQGFVSLWRSLAARLIVRRGPRAA